MNAITELADKIDARLNLNAGLGTEIRFTMTASAAAEYAKQLRLTAKMVDEIERLRAALAAQQDGAWQPIETAPSACHVLATRFDECEWMVAVVSSPPTKPFTHWRPLPAPPPI